MPAWVRELRDRVVEHFEGRVRDFSDVKLDLSGVPDFHARVIGALRKIGVGRTITYGELAAKAGSPGAARAVGTAMRTNPYLLVVPCHRVTASGGKLGGFSAPGGEKTKRAMLDLERQEGVHDLPYDADGATRELAKKDKRLGKVIARSGPIRLRRAGSGQPFEMLAKAILYQQLAAPAARAIHGRFVALVGTDAEKLVRVKESELRKCGISTPKLLALRDLAKRTVAGEIPSLSELEQMSDDAIVSTLTKVRGIGPWTVHMLLLFNLGRPDVWPIDDYGIRKGWAKIYGKKDLPKPKVLLEHGEKYKPFRSVAAWYMWRALE